jgi:hypothetical protein
MEQLTLYAFFIGRHSVPKSKLAII